ncbi:MAG: GNAT family N-acetyltransferase [Anaerolineaceae bacterium]
MKPIIRKAQPQDAAKIIKLINEIISEPDSNLEMSPGEFLHSLDQEQKILEDFSNSENSIFLIAEVEGEIIGSIICHGSSRKASRHSVEISMSVASNWRGKHIGTELMQAAVEWARNTNIIKRMDLIVFERNSTAIQLYEKFGFEKEGLLRKSIYRDGKYLNAYLMALLI